MRESEKYYTQISYTNIKYYYKSTKVFQSHLATACITEQMNINITIHLHEIYEVIIINYIYGFTFQFYIGNFRCK